MSQDRDVVMGEPWLEPEMPRFQVWLVWLLLATLTGLWEAIPNLFPARAQGRGSGSPCRSNCKNIATALEMYADDHGGLYPPVLSPLTAGNYLKLIPTCPAAGSDTYSQAYQTAHNPERFSFYCTGNNHAKTYTGFSTSCSNFPQYSSAFGLLEHP